VAVEHGFINRDIAIERMLTTLQFFWRLIAKISTAILEYKHMHENRYQITSRATAKRFNCIPKEV
jgi:hypothetical protein